MSIEDERTDAIYAAVTELAKIPRRKEVLLRLKELREDLDVLIMHLEGH
jgi:hypothetical protein